MTRLEILAEAAWDLEKAAFWYDSQRIGLGIELTDEAYSLFQRIEENPFQFPVV